MGKPLSHALRVRYAECDAQDVVFNAHYLRPAHFDEELRLEVAMEPLGTTSLPSRHRVWRGEELLVEGSLRHVMIDRETFAKTPIPQWLRDALAPWTVERSDGPALL